MFRQFLRPPQGGVRAPASSGGSELPSVFFTLIVPAALLTLLIVSPPHALDFSVAKLFYADGWPWHADQDVALWLHKVPKAVPVAVALAALAWCATKLAQGRRLLADDVCRRVLCVFTSMALCGIAVWWLKGTTGVSCPWNVDAFGGSRSVTDPIFSLGFVPGNCWPAGHAGTGFCLFSLYFALRGIRPRLARAALVFALLFGTLCGAVRVMQGAHFVSHVAASALIDWMICGAVAGLFFGKTGMERLRLSAAALILFTAFWWTVVFDAPLFRDLTVKAAGFAWSSRTLALTASLCGAFFAVGAALVTALTLLPRTLCRLLLIVLAAAGAASMAGGVLYGMVFTPDMAKNFLATDAREALAYVSPRTVLLFLAALLPPVLAALYAELPESGRLKSLLRAGAAVTMLFAGLGLIVLNMQSFAGLMRENKSLRYEIAPVNVVWSAASAVLRDVRPAGAVAKTHIDPAPHLTAAQKRPAVLLFVVGETTRSDDWGLAGYERNTTPELAGLDVISVPRAEACGTSTDVSLPCMMSRIGRSNYSRARILAEESLPGLLKRAGADVVWVDNQSGCKGTCEGVSVRRPEVREPDCPKGECYDSVLLAELGRDLADLPADRPTVLFYHMLGQHGPAYSARSPDEDKAWLPECRDADLGACSRESIRNAYDNGVKHTDRVLAGLIRMLQARTDIDSAFIFASDHGESLGEQGLFLHGAPLLVAPAGQTEVPMVFWLSDGWEKTFGVSRTSLRATAAGRVTHEHLFSTVLGLLGIQSAAARAEWDLTGTVGRKP
ncbi:MAG: sulfatase-like hydrolase/transferase [Sutterella sp.]|nr:sulfatase-like hydrolase/transferase [Sutterella sp.]